jgi:hypothetical protein
MNDDVTKATEGTADGTDTLKHIGGSQSDAWNAYIGAQALASIRPYIGDEEKRDKMRAIVAAGLTGIAPRDEMEGMIAAQMLACHDTAMGCFRDALNSKLHGASSPAPSQCCSTRSIAIAARASRRSRSSTCRSTPAGRPWSVWLRPRGEGFSRNRRIKPMQGRFPMHLSPRCLARTRRGTPCKSPAMANGRCRMHGGMSPGAPKGNKNALKHGFYSADAIANRLKVGALLRAARNLFTAQRGGHFRDTRG